MGRASGAGSPIWFKCPVERRAWDDDRRHDVMLTGRTKPFRSRRARGARSTDVSREYECQTCGHRGWSAHADLARIANRQADAPATE